MKKFLAFLLLAAPLLGQTPTPTRTPTSSPTVTPTITPTPTPIPPSKFSLATQVRPGFGTSIVSEATFNKLGDTYYATNWRTLGMLPGNTTTTQKFWCQVGTGSVSAAPSWCPLTVGGNVVGASGTTFANKFIVQGTADTGLTAAQFLGALGTGILKNTTTTGVLSIATGSDFPIFAGSTPGMVPDATGAGAGTYLDKSGGFSQPTGSFVSPLTTKGDTVCYDTGDTRCGVTGHNGYALSEDSSVAKGLSYQPPLNAIGKGIFTWGYVTRTTGTVYQNSSSYAMLLLVQCASTGTGNCEILSDAANPPTVSRGKTSNQNTYGLWTVSWVLPSHYYKIIATTANISTVAEYVMTKGTLTDSGDLSGSRALGNVYQNTSGGAMFVGIEVGTSGSVQVLTDSANPPTTQTVRFAIQSGVGITPFFIVENNHYYKVVQGGSASIVKWYEWTFDASVVVTRSADLTTLLSVPGGNAAGTRVNVSGRSLFVSHSGHSTTTGSCVFYATPLVGFSFGTIVPNSESGYTTTGSATAYRQCIGLVNPMEPYVIASVTGTPVNDAIFEYVLE